MEALDIHRLNEIVVEEVAAARTSGSPERCCFHALHYECCPDRLSSIIEPGAARLGLHASGRPTGSVPAMIVNTVRGQDASRADVGSLRRGSVEVRVGSVSVIPSWVALCSGLPSGTDVRVPSVVGFPLGATTSDVEHYETRR